MTLTEKILSIYPELSDRVSIVSADRAFTLQDNADGKGLIIVQWNYKKPQPTQEQLEALE